MFQYCKMALLRRNLKTLCKQIHKNVSIYVRTATLLRQTNVIKETKVMKTFASICFSIENDFLPRFQIKSVISVNETEKMIKFVRFELGLAWAYMIYTCFAFGQFDLNWSLEYCKIAQFKLTLLCPISRFWKHFARTLCKIREAFKNEWKSTNSLFRHFFRASQLCNAIDDFGLKHNDTYSDFND